MEDRTVALKPDSFTQKRHFIIALGKMLHRYGATTYRLENHLKSVSKLLDVPASFVLTPTSLTFVLYNIEDQQEYNFIVRVDPGGIDLASLSHTNQLVEELSSGQRTLNEAIQRLQEIEKMPPPYPAFLTFLGFGASSGAFAMLLGTSWNDIFWSTLLGFVVFLLVLWSERSKGIANALEPLSSIVTALLASAITLIDPTVNAPLVILSSIIPFIPGLSLTTGLSELAERHLISGTAKIMDAIMVLFKLYFGAILGLTIGNLMWGAVEMVEVDHVPAWTAWLAVLILSSSLVITFKTRPRHAFWGILCGFIAFGSSAWADLYLGASLSAFVGAFAIGIYSSMFARIGKEPAAVVLLHGLVVLVPGSKVYIGLNTMITGSEIIRADHIGSQTFLIFMSLVAGLIFANVALRPKDAL
ncbi:threonine/serine exporter family protein [Thalassotalea ponticola]|uniref:threonine/serine ThrE exporter family protein n=1 Tax=Thalassotalea ponticola TaxID=1523392 RepID=UPI0025B379EC|nr:threonine/serine exporter family protein [Thalassotalea ponticola]MDN3652019.1 threonine/serine exporter family protein [Thalassotalea ponticola]